MVLYQMKGVLKFVTIMHGAQCVIMVGMLWMPMWPANNLDTLDTVSYYVKIMVTLCRSLYDQSNKFGVNNEIVNQVQTELCIVCNCFIFKVARYGNRC